MSTVPQTLPPSVPAQNFARPVPAINQPVQVDPLSRPGPFGAQGQAAPRIGQMQPSGGIPPSAPAALSPGAVAPASGYVLPAAIIALPGSLAIPENWMGGRPILGDRSELDAISRGRLPGSPWHPDTPKGAEPPNRSPSRKDPSRAKRPPVRGILGVWTITGAATFYNGTVLTTSATYPGYSTDSFSFAYSATDGWNLYQNGILVEKTWSRTQQQGGADSVVVGGKVFNVPPPSSPPLSPNPNPSPPQPQNNAPKIPPLPNSNQPAPNPNPANPGGLVVGVPAPSVPSTPNPAAPSSPVPAKPTNPSVPSPNPSIPSLPSVPNPSTPSLPSLPTLPVPSIPSLPSFPSSPSIPGPVRPIGSGAPNNPNPCKPDPCLDSIKNQVDLVEIAVKKFNSCDRKLFGVKLPFDKQLIRVPRMEAEAWELSLNNQAEILLALCRECDEPIAAIPEWWQTRLGAERPQLIIQYAAMFEDGTFDKAKYSISIPYWNKSKEQTEVNDFPIYRKGQYMAQLILRDNSKVIVNCFSEDVCDDVIDKLSQSINPSQ